jgi:chitinase
MLTSPAGHFNFVTSSGARAKFITDAIQLIEDYGFDGMYVRRSCSLLGLAVIAI